MNTADVRNQMMKLWKRTFEDSDEYIKLIFDSYYDYDLIEYESDEDKVVAAMMVVPYKFKFNTGESYVDTSININEQNDDIYLNGLYLCGLATDEKYRGKGIMSKLIERVNAKAERLNFDFTFLIPASAGLVKYYQERDYVNAIYRAEKWYSTVYDFRNDYIDRLKNTFLKRCNSRSVNERDSKLAFNNSLEYFNSLNMTDYNNSDEGVRAKIRDYIYRYEMSLQCMNMIHSHQDIKIVCEENQLSDGKIIAAVDMSQSVVGVAVLVLTDGVMEVRCLYCDGAAERARLLQSVADVLAVGQRLFVVYDVTEEVRPVAGEFSNPDATLGDFRISAIDAKPKTDSLCGITVQPQVYGLVRLLNPRHVLELLAGCGGVLNNQILMDYSIGGNVAFTTATGMKYCVCDSKFLKNESKLPFRAANRAVKISVKELSEILFRPRYGTFEPLCGCERDSNGAPESLDMPAVPLFASLLLD